MSRMTEHGDQFCLTRRAPGIDCRICGARPNGFCSLLSGEALAYLRRLASRRSFARRRPLCRADEALDKVYFLQSGVVQLYQTMPDGRRQITGFLGPGDILGGLKRMRYWHCTAEAVTDVKACCFERDEFQEFLRRFPDMAMALLVVATDEIEALHDHLILLGCRNAREKVATLLLLLNHRWSVDADPADVVWLPMRRTDLADYLGLSLETVSRTISALRRARLIATPEPHSVTLLNRPALIRMAGFDDLTTRHIAIGL